MSLQVEIQREVRANKHNSFLKNAFLLLQLSAKLHWYLAKAKMIKDNFGGFRKYFWAPLPSFPYRLWHRWTVQWWVILTSHCHLCHGNYCETQHLLSSSIFPCPASETSPLHFHYIMFYTTYTNHTFSESSWYPLSTDQWLLTHLYVASCMSPSYMWDHWPSEFRTVVQHLASVAICIWYKCDSVTTTRWLEARQLCGRDHICNSSTGPYHWHGLWYLQQSGSNQ